MTPLTPAGCDGIHIRFVSCEQTDKLVMALFHYVIAYGDRNLFQNATGSDISLRRCLCNQLKFTEPGPTPALREGFKVISTQTVTCDRGPSLQMQVAVQGNWKLTDVTVAELKVMRDASAGYGAQPVGDWAAWHATNGECTSLADLEAKVRSLIGDHEALEERIEFIIDDLTGMDNLGNDPIGVTLADWVKMMVEEQDCANDTFG